MKKHQHYNRTKIVLIDTRMLTRIVTPRSDGRCAGEALTIKMQMAIDDNVRAIIILLSMFSKKKMNNLPKTK